MRRRTVLQLFGGVAVAGLPAMQLPATGGRDRADDDLRFE